MGYGQHQFSFNYPGSKVNPEVQQYFLSSSNNALETVTITGIKPLIKQETDRIIYDIQADPDSKTDNMLMLMQKIPYLTVDGEDRLQLKGSSDFKILVDGRSTGMMARSPNEALRMMKAITVKQVEVLTNPSAKYDSEGLAGVINIITQKNVTGVMLYNLVHVNSRIGRGFESSVTAKKGKLGLYVWSGYWRHDLLKTHVDNLRTNLAPAASSVRQKGYTTAKGYDFPITAELGYEIDSLNLLNVSFATTKDLVNNFGDQNFNHYDQANVPIYAYSLQNNNTTDLRSYDLGINYQLSFLKNKNRQFSAAYRFSRSNTDFGNENFYYGYLNYNNQFAIQRNRYGTDEQTIQLDYNSPLKKLGLETGIKLVLRDYFSNDSNNSIGLSNNVTSDLTYRQHILGGYQSYQYRHQKWSFKFGVRMEYTKIDADFVSNQVFLARDFLNLIPSIAIGFGIKNSWNANLTYTQRIQRPAIWQLNPFVNESNPLYFTFGNPNLKPALFHVAEFGLSRFKKTSYAFNLGYTFARNTIQSIAYAGLDQITRASFQNLGKTDQYAINTSIGHPFGKKMNLNANLKVQYIVMEGQSAAAPLHNSGLVASGNMGLTFRANANLRISPSIQFNSRQPTLQGNASGNLFSYLNISQQLLQKKMNITLHLYNPFNRFLSVNSLTQGLGFIQENSSSRMQRGFYLAVNYTLGQLKERIKKAKSVNNDDLAKRPEEN